MGTFPVPDDLPDPAGLSDWDLYSSYWAYRAFKEGPASGRGAFAALMSALLLAESAHRGIDLAEPMSPLDLSWHSPSTPPVV